MFTNWGAVFGQVGCVNPYDVAWLIVSYELCIVHSELCIIKFVNNLYKSSFCPSHFLGFYKNYHNTIVQVNKMCYLCTAIRRMVRFCERCGYGDWRESNLLFLVYIISSHDAPMWISGQGIIASFSYRIVFVPRLKPYWCKPFVRFPLGSCRCCPISW